MHDTHCGTFSRVSRSKTNGSSLRHRLIVYGHPSKVSLPIPTATPLPAGIACYCRVGTPWPRPRTTSEAVREPTFREPQTYSENLRLRTYTNSYTVCKRLRPSPSKITALCDLSLCLVVSMFNAHSMAFSDYTTPS